MSPGDQLAQHCGVHLRHGRLPTHRDRDVSSVVGIEVNLERLRTARSRHTALSVPSPWSALSTLSSWTTYSSKWSLQYVHSHSGTARSQSSAAARGSLWITHWGRPHFLSCIGEDFGNGQEVVEFEAGARYLRILIKRAPLAPPLRSLLASRPRRNSDFSSVSKPPPPLVSG